MTPTAAFAAAPSDSTNRVVISQSSAAGQNTPSQAGPLYNGQKLCPVSGEELGSMGPPIPVTVAGQTVYVCCEGCVKKVQGDPEHYLAKVMSNRSIP